MYGSAYVCSLVNLNPPSPPPPPPYAARPNAGRHSLFCVKYVTVVQQVSEDWQLITQLRVCTK